MTRRRLAFAVAAVLAIAATLHATQRRDPEVDAARGIAEVGSGRIEVWTTLMGELGSARTAPVAARAGGNAALVMLAPEGRRVVQGELVAELDATEARRALVQLEQDEALARAELEGLKRGKHPIELAELAVKRSRAEQELARERSFLAESEALAVDGLISTAEVDDLRRRIAELAAERDATAAKEDLTRRFLHPTELTRAEAKLRAAEQALALGRERVEAARVLAPMDGVMVHRPVQIGSEFRPARVGDLIGPNVQFATVTDPGALVVRALVAETDLARLAVGAPASVSALAFPDTALEAKVAAIGGAAQFVPGRPTWQRFFTVELALAASDARLRPGMSVEARVLGQARDDAVLVPRVAVRWERGQPTVTVVHALYERPRPIRVGLADAAHYEVLDGLEPGDEVRLP
jgi:multidrug efflux pump subunit AcrA (membrane-fusion protein)